MGMVDQRQSDFSRLFHHFLMMETSGRMITDFHGHPRMLGVVPHAGGAAVVEIWEFDYAMVSPPAVNCLMPWVYRRDSWHYQVHDSRFCWVMKEEWGDWFSNLRSQGMPADVMAMDASAWLVGAMRYVLSRHWTGYQFGMVDWHPKWEDYSHGHDGVREYQKGTYRQS
jgi:hypothetical protein